MLQLQVVQVKYPVAHEAAVDVNTKETYVTFRSVEKVLGLREDSFREILASKSLKAFTTMDLVSGKKRALLLGTTLEGTPKQNVITTALFMVVVTFVNTTESLEFLKAHAEFGYHTNVLTSAGIAVDGLHADDWWKARIVITEDYQPLLCAWHKVDIDAGITTCPYGGFVQNVKRAGKVDLVKPDEMDAAMLKRYHSMIKAYDLLRKLGMTDKQARVKLTELY